MSFDLNRFNTLADFTAENIISAVIEVEGGYTNNPNDRGGETIYGITRSVAENHKHLWSKYNFNGNMKDMPKALAYDIYYQSYWRRTFCPQLSQIHPLIAFHVFDLAVNGGSGSVVKQLQRLLNVLNRQGRDYPDLVVDGIIGQRTVDALSAFVKRNGHQGLRNFIIGLGMLQGAFYINITENRQQNEVFMNGWLNRATGKMDIIYKFLG